MAKTFKHRWRENGRHRQRTFSTRAERDLFCAKLRLGTKTAAGGNETFAAFADVWCETHARVEKSESVAANDRMMLDRHLIPAFGSKRLQDLAADDLLALRQRLKEQPVGRYKRVLKPKTVNLIVALAKQVMAAAVQRGLLPVNPFQSVKLLKVARQPYGFWTAEERDRFLRFCRQIDPAFAELVQVAVATGLRKGELWALERADLDFQGRQIRVAATYDHKLEERLERTKNGEADHIPMNSLAYDVLKSRQLLPGTAPVFDEALLRDACHRFKRRCLETGTKPIRFHDLRHTFASNLVAAGVPIYDVQKLLRHKTIQMTMRYAHHAPGHLAAAAEAICAPSVRRAPESTAGGNQRAAQGADS